jgi:hypothetical protein
VVLLVREDLPEEVLGAVRTGLVKNVSGGASSTISPSDMNTTRLAARRAKPISWVTTSMVMPSLAEGGHHVEDLLDHLGVERGGGLVEQHDLGLHRQRAGDGGSLLLAAGELGGVLVPLVGDAHALQQRHPVALRLGLAVLRTLSGARVTFCRSSCGRRG